MREKTYKVRSLSAENGSKALDLNLEFEGSRAYVIWDTIQVGVYSLKARLEIDPNLLERVNRGCCDYVYSGKLVLPRPQDN